MRVTAVSLNHRDKMVIESGRGLPLTFPFTPGSDMAGHVVEVGAEAERFDPGDRVISTFTPGWIDGLRSGDARTPSYRTLGGFYPGVLAEYAVFPEEWLVAAPTTQSDVEASTLPCAGVTAWFSLVERGHVFAGQTVLVEGSGGVATFGVQIAKMHGAHVIASTSGSKFERMTALGADAVIDRHSDDWVEEIYALTGNRGADHVVEIVGGDHLGLAVSVTAVGGHVHQIGALDGFELSTPAMPLMLKDITVHGVGTGHRRALEDLVRAADRTLLKPCVDRCYAMTELPAALDHLDRGPVGKVVVGLV